MSGKTGRHSGPAVCIHPSGFWGTGQKGGAERSPLLRRRSLPGQRLAGCNTGDNDTLRTWGGHGFKGSSPELLKKLLLALLNARHSQRKGAGRPGAVRSAETVIPNRGAPGSGLCPPETQTGGVGKIGVQGGGGGASARQSGGKEGLSSGFLQLLGWLWAAL